MRGARSEEGLRFPVGKGDASVDIHENDRVLDRIQHRHGKRIAACGVLRFHTHAASLHASPGPCDSCSPRTRTTVRGSFSVIRDALTAAGALGALRSRYQATCLRA